jgi:DDE superfamily endonuclease
MSPCARHCLAKVESNGDKAMGCWCSTRRRFPSPVAGRWGWLGSGVVAWGKVDNCHVAISVGYVSRLGHTLVALRLSLPKDWTQEKARLDNAGVLKACRGFHTRHQLAFEMLEKNGASHRWMAGDAERGRPYWLHRRLAALGERDVLAMPSHTLMRDVETEPSPSRSQGRPPKRPWQSVKQGSSRSARQPGGGSTSAIVPKAHWWLTWSNDAGSPEPIDVSKATRSCGWVICSRDRDQAQVVKGEMTCPPPPWGHRCRSWTGWPQPPSVSKHASSAARAKPVWPTTRCAIGLAGSSIKRFCYWLLGSIEFT